MLGVVLPRLSPWGKKELPNQVKMFTIDQPFSLEGNVIDSHLVTPVSEYMSDREYYSITLMCPNLGDISEIQQCLEENAPIDQPLEIVGVSEKDYTITCHTLNKPRLNKGQGEFMVGDEVSVRAKIDIKQGDNTATGRVLLLMAAALEPIEFDWTTLSSEFDF